MEPARLKCNICKRVKFEVDFIKNKKVLKSCIACREKVSNSKKTQPEPDIVTPIIIQINVKEPEITVMTEITIEKMEQLHLSPMLENKIEKTENKIEKTCKWYTLSGRWIQIGDEVKLHKMFTKKLNRQFHKQSAFPVHKYLTRYLMVDIRDMYRATHETVYAS